MKQLPLYAAVIAVMCFCFSAIGCNESASSESSATSNSKTENDIHASDGESHDDNQGDVARAAGGDHVAPHGGQLIELGRGHLYHAEITDDHDNQLITVYMLDGKYKDLKVDSETISLTLSAGDESKIVEMTAAGKDSDAGSSFVTKNEAALAMIEADGVEGKVLVRIDGKPYTGTFE